MRVVVNAVALRSAGGRSVAINFLRACDKIQGEYQLDVFAPANCGYETATSAGHIRYHIVPDRLNKTLLRPVMDRYWLSSQIDALDPDVVFSMGNFAVPTKRKQVVVFMWPYATYPDDEVWKRLSWKDVQTRRAKITTFRKRLKYATVVSPQTKTSSDRLKRYYPDIQHIRVIPTAVSFTEYGKALSGDRMLKDWSDSRKKLLCLTRYYPHKNLEVLLDVATRIKNEKKPYTIITTVADEQHAGAKKFLEDVDRLGLRSVIQNIGPVPMDEVPALYEVTDGLLLPTLLESFSGTYVDAMHFEKPIFTSDRDFAHDVCNDVAFYFDPLSADNILSIVEGAFETPGLISDKSRAGARLVRQLPGWNDVAHMYLSLLEQTASGALRKEDEMSILNAHLPSYRVDETTTPAVELDGAMLSSKKEYLVEEEDLVL